MNTRKVVTITQVAKEAQVSTQTVSRVINDRPDVAPETRQRVLEVIARLDYRPNALARSLIHQRSHTLGVVATGLEYYGPSHALMGIEKMVRELGYSLLLDLLHHPETENVEQILNRLLSRQVDGIIWAVPEIGKNRDWLKRSTPHLPVPIIYLSMNPASSLATSYVDNRLGGRLAAEHLLACGYRRPGIIAGPLDWWEAEQRLQGWKDGLRNAGLTFEERHMVEGNWTASSGEEAIRRLLAQYPDMDSVFACNDQMALGALQAAHSMGRQVPHDLGVIGFDDIPESAYFWPALTTIDQPVLELGRQAVQELVRVIDANYGDQTIAPFRPVVLQPTLVVRSSTRVAVQVT